MGYVDANRGIYQTLMIANLAMWPSPLQARKWFKLDYGLHQKWMGGMKLGTLVYEKSGKSKSNNAPFVGTIRLHLAGIL